MPPLERMDLKFVLDLIDERSYFVLHAPRQTGKTSFLLALCDELNRSGRYRCVYVNFEGAQTTGNDVHLAMRTLLSRLADDVKTTHDDAVIYDIFPDILENHGPLDALLQTLKEWASRSDLPLDVLIDEIDALFGDTLISILRQLRIGYPMRPKLFPQSVVLCGVRDVRDCRIHSGSASEFNSGGSVFNIEAESLRLGDFSLEETKSLLEQHTQETGQRWSEGTIEEVWRLTQGQPWLVNALAYRAYKTVNDIAQPIEMNDIVEAKEQLILRRDTHLDLLTEKLKEQRVRSVIEPLLSGNPYSEDIPDDDIKYVQDLGLIKIDNGIRIANPIYQEMIPRGLSWETEYEFPQDPDWYIDEGTIKVDKLLADFQKFFRMYSENWVERFEYREAGPQLLLQAFLQRVVNSSGRMEREYGLGRRWTDLLIICPNESGTTKTVIECEIMHDSLESAVQNGLEQTHAYMDRCSAEQGHLVIFDRSEDKPWKEKIFCRSETVNDASITVWGM